MQWWERGLLALFSVTALALAGFFATGPVPMVWELAVRRGEVAGYFLWAVVTCFTVGVIALGLAVLVVIWKGKK